jgi:hypothetical protein
MTNQEATADVFFTAFKALKKTEQEFVLNSIINDHKLRRLIENLFDRTIIAEERAKPSRLLREYITAREFKEKSN